MDKRNYYTNKKLLVLLIAAIFFAVFIKCEECIKTKACILKDNMLNICQHHLNKITKSNIENYVCNEHYSASIFNDCKIDEIKYEYEEMASKTIKDWYALPITDASLGNMFNPVFLPFEYTCEEGVPDNNQKLTFPCLLAFKFDFVEDNYSSRHPAFIYRKEKGILETDFTDKKNIAGYIESWNATSAIGGNIVQVGDLYRGNMIVFDKNGGQIFDKSYNDPMEYFDLMGNMVKDWIIFRKQNITEGLLKEICRPMTNNIETLRMYGKNFDVKWRSQDEWNIYEKILEMDPCFAEIRYWYANQKAWATKNSDELKAEKVKAVVAHLVMMALQEASEEIGNNKCIDAETESAYRQCVQYAGEISPRHNGVIHAKLILYKNIYQNKDIDALVQYILQYPNSFILKGK